MQYKGCPKKILSLPRSRANPIAWYLVKQNRIKNINYEKDTIYYAIICGN